MFKLIKNFLALESFYFFSRRIQKPLLIFTLVVITAGLYGGLFVAPKDYQQGDAFRIIYVHVPAAWLSLFVYIYMVLAAFAALVWRLKIAEIGIRSAAPIGFCFTAIALVTGSIWGKPMWGTWWVWDARLTSELILLLIYGGIIGISNSMEDIRIGSRSAAVVTLIGAINIPIIHYSVEWWATLHQGPTVSKFDNPSIEITMLIPLIIMTIGFIAYFIYVLMIRMQSEIIRYERNSGWIRKEIS
ncbi:MAG: heme ABC transporter permease [Pseudomonadota bacterium]|nr:heme ABC transporter permease [Pseudomonadota bacterium]